MIVTLHLYFPISVTIVTQYLNYLIGLTIATYFVQLALHGYLLIYMFCYIVISVFFPSMCE